MNVAETVTSIIAEHCEIGTDASDLAANQHMRLETLELDSLAMLEIVFEIEEQLNVELPFDPAKPEEYVNATVSDIVERVEAILALQPSSVSASGTNKGSS